MARQTKKLWWLLAGVGIGLALPALLLLLGVLRVAPSTSSAPAETPASTDAATDDADAPSAKSEAALLLNVIDAFGNPAPNVHVTLTGDALDAPQTHRTDDQGSLDIEALTPGTYRIAAQRGEPEIYELAPLHLSAGDERELEARLATRIQNGLHLAVQVTGQGTHALSGARVRITGDSGEIFAEATTEANGAAQFSQLPLAFYAEASAPGFAPLVRPFRGRAGRAAEMTLHLTRADKALTGRVVDHLGRPIDGATVWARGNIRGTRHQLDTTTDTDGAFHIPDAADVRYQLSVEIEGVIRSRLSDAPTNTDITLMVAPGTAPSAPLPAPLPEIPGEGRGDNLGVVTAAADGPPVLAYTQGDTAPASSGAAPIPVGRGGLPITFSGAAGHVVVNSVEPGSGVAAAGLKVRARLLRIDGVNVQSVAQARTALLGRIGSVVMLDVLQDGEPLSLVVQRVSVP